tara:strand:+ start:1642 stop:2166 length:525 start_codon:yes stop_codon:yes gene_type:complete
MSFWTENSLEPKRNFRFRLGSTYGLDLGKTGKSPYWWSAKKVDKPSYTVNTNKYRLINHEINVPGIVSWNPIAIEIVDIGKTVSNLLSELKSFGYSPTELSADTGLKKTDAMKEIGEIRIEQMNGLGDPIETWNLIGGIITEARFGSLDYSSDELVSISLTIAYDYATFSEPEK